MVVYYTTIQLKINIDILTNNKERKTKNYKLLGLTMSAFDNLHWVDF